MDKLSNAEKRFLTELSKLAPAGGLQISNSKSAQRMVELGYVSIKLSAVGNFNNIYTLTDLGREAIKNLWRMK